MIALLAVLAGIMAGAVSAQPPTTAPADPIRLDQIGVETEGDKIAVLATDDPAPRRWSLLDADGRVVSTGTTRPFGPDPASGERLHQIDFSAYRVTGNGYRLTVGDARSGPFAIVPRPFASLATASLGFFYQQRSGVPILATRTTRPDLARAAGQPDERVTCFAGRDGRGVDWPGCRYHLNTTGGWYDAGDHGKYVVNGGIAVWTLLDLEQRLAIRGTPERRNALLDEAKVEVAFLLSMQVPAGQKLRLATVTDTGAPASGFVTIDAGGMAHTKVADEYWTGLPMAPADDPMRRFLYPPSTAATLNLAAVAAQAARVWRTGDPGFAAKALAAAMLAWDAAERHPALFASSDFTGSGGYGDRDVTDERFWAAAELLATTGDARYAAVVRASPFLTKPSGELNWGRLDQAGLMTLATAAGPIPEDIRRSAGNSIMRLADGFVAERRHSGYRLPFASPDYGWGSNAGLLNRAMILGVAWQIAGTSVYRQGAVDVIDYVLGRNPLDQSYVTGFGRRTVHQPHHRFWAHAIDPRYPAPPPGVLVGGPNSTAMTDEVSAAMKGRCRGSTCWVDDWRAFTMNEVAINWNAPLVWVAAFLDSTPAGGDSGERP